MAVQMEKGSVWGFGCISVNRWMEKSLASPLCPFLGNDVLLQIFCALSFAPETSTIWEYHVFI